MAETASLPSWAQSLMGKEKTPEEKHQQWAMFAAGAAFMISLFIIIMAMSAASATGVGMGAIALSIPAIAILLMACIKLYQLLVDAGPGVDKKPTFLQKLLPQSTKGKWIFLGILVALAIALGVGSLGFPGVAGFLAVGAFLPTGFLPGLVSGLAGAIGGPAWLFGMITQGLTFAFYSLAAFVGCSFAIGVAGKGCQAVFDKPEDSLERRGLYEPGSKESYYDYVELEDLDQTEEKDIKKERDMKPAENIKNNPNYSATGGKAPAKEKSSGKEEVSKTKKTSDIPYNL